jgi:hypothetical protein
MVYGNLPSLLSNSSPRLHHHHHHTISFSFYFIFASANDNAPLILDLLSGLLSLPYKFLQSTTAPARNEQNMSVEVSATSTNTATTDAEQEAEQQRSALQDNIERKGKNAYYFAHAHKATGPKWDGKIEPKLLSIDSNLSSVSTSSMTSISKLSLMAKSNITNYAFLDDGLKVKIYVNLPGVGDCDDDNITIDFTERSLCLTVKDYAIPSPSASKDEDGGDHDDDGGDNKVEDIGELIVDTAPQTVKDIMLEAQRKEDRRLTFAKLYGDIENATFKKKPDKVIITLVKKVDSKWNSVIA